MWQLIACVLLVVTVGFESSDCEFESSDCEFESSDREFEYREFESQAWPGPFSVILGSCSLQAV
jgi:hypothetical protein